MTYQFYSAKRSITKFFQHIFCRCKRYGLFIYTFILKRRLYLSFSHGKSLTDYQTLISFIFAHRIFYEKPEDTAKGLFQYNYCLNQLFKLNCSK